jgi:thioredoxin reductase
VLGGGDAAFDYALNLAERGFYVDIVLRGEPTCLPLLLERANLSEKIRMHGGTELKSVSEADRQLVFVLDEGGTQRDLVADFGLIACGRKADLSILPPELAENWTKTSGLHLVGDVRRGNFRQVGIAVGDGILTAMSIVQSSGVEK